MFFPRFLFFLLGLAAPVTTVAAGSRINIKNPGLELIVIAERVDSAQGLYLVRDHINRQFSIAECPGQPSTSVVLQCDLLIEKWLPSRPEIEAAYDDSLTLLLIEEDEKLRLRYGHGAILQNLAIASMTGATFAAGMQMLGLHTKAAAGPDLRMLAVVVVADLVTFGILQVRDHFDEQTNSIPSDLASRGLQSEEQRAFSDLVYAILKSCLRDSLNLPQRS